MIKRFFWFFVGITVGALSTWWTARKAKKIAQTMNPPQLVGKAEIKTKLAAKDMSVALKEGYKVARKRASDLREN